MPVDPMVASKRRRFGATGRLLQGGMTWKHSPRTQAVKQSKSGQRVDESPGHQVSTPRMRVAARILGVLTLEFSTSVRRSLQPDHAAASSRRAGGCVDQLHLPSRLSALQRIAPSCPPLMNSLF